LLKACNAFGISLDLKQRQISSGIIVLLLFLSPMFTYADTGDAEVLDIYKLSQEYYSLKEVYKILGVRISLEMTSPKLLINGENHTFTYRVQVSDAPSGWLLNITKIYLRSGNDCFPDYVQKVRTVLRGGESLTGQFTVRAIRMTLNPGSSAICYPRLTIDYFAEFGANRIRDWATVTSSDVYMKSRELPLELRPKIFASVERHKYGFAEYKILRFSGEIKVKNVQSVDIILTSYTLCYSNSFEKALFGGFCRSHELPSSTVLKPGDEYALIVKDEDTFIFDEPKPPWYIKYVIKYLHPNGKVENWLAVRISRETTIIGTQMTRGTTTATEVIKSPTTAAITVTTTTTRPTVPLGGAPIGPGTPTYLDTFFGILMLMVPIALVTIAGVAIAAYSARKSRTMQSRPKAEETTQVPSMPTDQSTTQVGTQRTEPSPPTSQETTQSRIAPPSQPEQPKPPQPKLQTPAWLHARSKAIISKLASARTRIELGDLNDAILELHKAVNATISLILEAEGLSMKGPDGEELKMGEKFRLIAERGWVSWNHRRYFTRLQYLRNMIEHSPERIHTLQTTASEVRELFRFHENFVRTSLRTLEELAKED
jgi:hypothetical protein